MEFLPNKSSLDRATCYEEKLANSDRYLRHLLEIKPSLFENLKKDLINFSNNDKTLSTIFAGIKESLSYNPSLYYQKKDIVQEIIQSSLNIKNPLGFESLLQIIMSYFDDFEESKRSKIIDKLKNNYENIQERKKPIFQICISLLGFLMIILIQKISMMLN